MPFAPAAKVRFPPILWKNNVLRAQKVVFWTRRKHFSDQAGIDCHALTADETFCNAPRHRRFEQVTQQFTLAEPTMSVLGKVGMIGNAVVQIEATEPAIGEVQMRLFAQSPLRSDAKAVANQKHSDQQLGID
jgi:hypothetical protein